MKKSLIAIPFTLSLFFWMTSAYSAEYATFEALYKESVAIEWIKNIVITLVTLGVLYLSGGAASPAVISIGTWVGKLMGLQGIVATKAGLALLGGGSIAAGGFGMIGGVTVLTAALTFSEEVLVDATIGMITSEYNYKKLAEESKNMTNLPIPKNTSGPDSYEEAIEILEKIDNEQSISSDHNQSIIRQAIGMMDSTSDGVLDNDEYAKKFSLYALLYFLTNDYQQAIIHANSAINFSRIEKMKRTLPAFIYATSSLYEEKFDYEELTKDYFSYSVLAEPENPLILLLFSVYLDRVMMRIDDRTLDADALKHVLWIGENNKLSEYHLIIYTSLLSRYFIRLKFEQQLISSFATQANNPSIQKIADKVLPKLRQSHEEYKKLLDGVLATSGALLSAVGSSDDMESKAEAHKFSNLYDQYKNDEPRLAELIINFEKKIAEIKEAKPDNFYFFLILIIAIGLLITGLIASKVRRFINF